MTKLQDEIMNGLLIRLTDLSHQRETLQNEIDKIVVRIQELERQNMLDSIKTIDK